MLAFVRRVATETFGSSEYALYRKLLAASGPPGALTGRDNPETLLVNRMASFDRAGVLHAPDAKRAAEHFVALTFLIALDALEKKADAAALDNVLADGVDAFIRAYAPRS